MSELDEAGVEAAREAVAPYTFTYRRKIAEVAITAYQQATEAALTQALAERDGLREALEQLLMAEGKTLSCGLVHPEFDVHHPEGHPNPTRIFIEAVLATAPNTKDGEKC